jgi:hypothetical protein
MTPTFMGEMVYTTSVSLSRRGARRDEGGGLDRVSDGEGGRLVPGDIFGAPETTR